MGIPERVAIYIDGANFHYLVLKKLGVKEIEFSFEQFVVFLANGRTVPRTGKRYYIGTVREITGNDRSKHAMSEQTRFFTVLHHDGWEIKTSKLRIRTERISIDDRVEGYQEILAKGVHEVRFQRTREKGIDVKLATDVLVGAFDDQYDAAIVVSSDTDLIPAIDWVRHRKGKRVEYIGFSIPGRRPDEEPTRPIATFLQRTDVQRVLVESDLRRFIVPKLV